MCCSKALLCAALIAAASAAPAVDGKNAANVFQADTVQFDVPNQPEYGTSGMQIQDPNIAKYDAAMHSAHHGRLAELNADLSADDRSSIAASNYTKANRLHNEALVEGKAHFDGYKWAQWGGEDATCASTYACNEAQGKVFCGEADSKTACEHDQQCIGVIGKGVVDWQLCKENEAAARSVRRFEQKYGTTGNTVIELTQRPYVAPKSPTGKVLYVNASDAKYNPEGFYLAPKMAGFHYSPGRTRDCCFHNCEQEFATLEQVADRKHCKMGCRLWLGASSLNWEGREWHSKLQARCRTQCGRVNATHLWADKVRAGVNISVANPSLSQYASGRPGYQSYFEKMHITLPLGKESLCENGCDQYKTCIQFLENTPVTAAEHPHVAMNPETSSRIQPDTGVAGQQKKCTLTSSVNGTNATVPACVEHIDQAAEYQKAAADHHVACGHYECALQS
jgi:hypothetical protein